LRATLRRARIGDRRRAHAVSHTAWRCATVARPRDGCPQRESCTGSSPPGTARRGPRRAAGRVGIANRADPVRHGTRCRLCASRTVSCARRLHETERRNDMGRGW